MPTGFNNNETRDNILSIHQELDTLATTTRKYDPLHFTKEEIQVQRYDSGLSLVNDKAQTQTQICEDPNKLCTLCTTSSKKIYFQEEQSRCSPSPLRARQEEMD